MGFKEIHYFIKKQYPELSDSSLQVRDGLFRRLRSRPFWIWGSRKLHEAEDIKTKGDCCFNHIIGLPVKSNTERPLYPYQRIVYDALDKHKHVFIKKSTGLGIRVHAALHGVACFER